MRKRIALVAACTLSVMVLHNVSWNDTQAQPNATDATEKATSDQSSTERGMYIVHHVAMCIYCHTPKTEDGALQQRQLLQGAPMPVESPFPRLKWAFQAPKIAGLPGGWTEDDLVRFLQTGITPTGRMPQPPMPPFRMNEEDAQSVAAYLKSL